MTSAGISMKNDPPFDMEREMQEPTWGDPSIRFIPSTAVESDIDVNHLHINTDYIKQDINVMLPLGGLAVAVFAGWGMRRSSSRDELALGSGLAFEVWRFVIRYIAPAGVLAVFLNVLGLI